MFDFSTLHADGEVELRRLDESHAQQLFDLIDANRAYLRQWLPWLDDNLRVEDTLQFIYNDRVNYEHGRCFNAGTWFRQELVGVIGFHPIDWVNRSAMIGYWLAEDQQGNGVMTRACRALVSYGFDTLQLHRVEIRCATGNERSCAIPKRLGFEHEGILREAEWLYDHYVDLHLFSILAQQWTMSTLKSSTHELR